MHAATAEGIDTAALSLPRGNGKSWLAAQLIAKSMTPGDRLFAPGKESILMAGSMEQARIVFRFVRDMLEDDPNYKFQDSSARIGITHKLTNTRLRTISSNAKTAMGLVNNPLVVCDEPGSWETNGGELMYDAVSTAQGKPGSPLRAVYIGTLAPAMRGWWHDLVKDGSTATKHITVLRGDPARWDYWHEIKRCNPLVAIDKKFQDKLLEERDEARRDTRLKARFLSYRLNCPSPDEVDVLLTEEDWLLVRAREVPPPVGQPIVGIDLGQGRSWSAAVAIWPGGRCEAIAVAPGIPDLPTQEKRDRVPRNTYTRLQQAGVLTVAPDMHVPPVSLLTNWITSSWGIPAAIICDRFRVNELRDCGLACPLYPRVANYSESSFDIRSLRRLARDGPLAVPQTSEVLILESLIHAKVVPDTSGNVRLEKRDPGNNTGRDDVAAALVLVAGASARRPEVIDAPMFRLVG